MSNKIFTLIIFFVIYNFNINAVSPFTDVASSYKDLNKTDNKTIDFTVVNGKITKSVISTDISTGSKVYPSTGTKKVLAILLAYSDLAFSQNSYIASNKKNINFMYASMGLFFIILIGIFITKLGGKRGIYLNILQVFIISSLITLAGCPVKEKEDPKPFNIYDKILNGSGMSFNKYYKDMSNNQLNVTFDFVGPYKASNTLSYYGANDGSGNDQNLSALINEALNKAYSAGVNFANYDDGTGHLSFVIIHAGAGEEAYAAGVHPEYIWSCSGKASSGSIDGLSFDRWAVVPEYFHTAGDSTIGVFCHEFGHMLGLPDLYDTEYTTKGVGNWSLMASGSWNGPNNGDYPAPLLAWEKKKLGWITVNDAISGSNTIGDIETSRTAFKVNLHGSGSTEQYYLIEKKVQSIGTWAQYLPGNGLLITHVDENILANTLNYNTVNSNSINVSNNYLHGVNIKEADNDNYLWDGSGSQTTDCFINKTLDNSSSPNTKYFSYSGLTYTSGIIQGTPSISMASSNRIIVVNNDATSFNYTP